MCKLEKYLVGFFICVFSVFLFFSMRMELGTMQKPETGFVPALVGVFGLLVSIINMIPLIRRKEEASSGEAHKDGLFRLAGYLISIIVFIALFKPLGSLLSIFAVVLALTKLSNAKGWVFPIILAVSCTVMSNLLFEAVLAVSLPKGILEFLFI